VRQFESRPRRGAARAAATLLTAAAVTFTGAGAAFGLFSTGGLDDLAGLAGLGQGSTTTVAAPDEPGTSPTTGPAARPSAAARPRVVADRPVLRPRPEPEPLLERGDTGREVRELQHRLFQIAWFTPPTTGEFDAETVAAVEGFQRKRGFEVTGEVDRRTWRRVVAMTRPPTDDELFNRAGPALLEAGDSGAEVRELQARLRQIGWFFGDVTDHYGDDTAEAVRGFQAKRMIPVTGAVDQRTLDLLHGMTREPTARELANKPAVAPRQEEGAPLDPRCLTGRVLCIDKSSNSLRWVVDGEVVTTVDVRFGSDELPTREGLFSVQWKSRDHVSSLYDTPMPYAMFFSGGQAVHYSPDFAANGYAGASHGCVNVRDLDTVAWLFDQVRVGDDVVVYWS
jgi:peptidoglycan hydrolase-like protein with peptidoglycan-binding domain